MGKQRRRLCGPESRRADRRPQRGRFARISVDVAFNAFTVRGHSIYDCTGNPVSAHPHGLAQCTRFIAEHHLQPEPASSNAAACRDLKPGRVALGPSICGELYDLDTLAEHVQDFDGAHTEFLVIAPRDVVQELTPAPTAMTPATSKPSSPSSRWSPAPAYSRPAGRPARCGTEHDQLHLAPDQRPRRNLQLHRHP